MSTDVSPAPATRAFKGNDRALLGIVLGVITFWLFAGTIGTIARSVLNDINGARSTRSPTRWSTWTR